MIKFENVKVEGFEPAIRGMRNPKNSWAKSDSGYGCNSGGETTCSECQFKPQWCGNSTQYIIGPADKELMLKLNNGGPVHAKYRRQIVVWVDITAPLYWWKEFDTYRFGRERNSCSTMHKIAEREFTVNDFSNEHLDNEEICVREVVDTPVYDREFTSFDIHYLTIKSLNYWRNEYLKATEAKNTARAKHCWWQLIQLNPDCYNQRATIMMSYEVLANIRKFRKNHKLDEWADSFMEFIDSLPYSWIITAEVPGMEVAPRDPHPYDLSDEKKREIMQQPDVEPEFYCRITPDEIPDFERWMKTKSSMDLYVDNQFVGELWSTEQLMAYTPKPTQLGLYDLGFRIIDHEKGKDLQMDYSMDRYSHAFTMDPIDCRIRMQLYRKE